MKTMVIRLLVRVALGIVSPTIAHAEELICPPDHPNLVTDAAGAYCVDFGREHSVSAIEHSPTTGVGSCTLPGSVTAWMSTATSCRESNGIFRRDAQDVGAAPYSGYGR